MGSDGIQTMVSDGTAPQSTDTPSMSLPGVLLRVLLLLAAAGVASSVLPALFHAGADSLREERGWGAVPAETKNARAGQLERLEKYRWLDREAGVVALPIERAMELVVEEGRARQSGEDGR